MDQPQPGDLVMEITPFASGGFDPHSVGRLLRIDTRPGWPARYVIEPLLRPGEERDGLDLSIMALPDQMSYARWAEGR
ncbi:hypothetical protein [Streptomyces albicerus]|uniref:hypothetical protein n=1 Tax=Streptomyces albicerus TaxID=2569859 RepID=UPI00124AEF0F|nr:hypothetical protein [Streptomyces albicerus]